MNYSAIEFLLAFPVFCALYWVLRTHRQRLVWMLAGSLAFYAYGDVRGLGALAFVGLVGFFGGLAIHSYRARSATILAICAGVLVLTLAFFKYASAATGISAAVGSVVPPLGISFFTFEAIAYLVDVRRGVAPVERSPLRYALYVTLFPHLISGPIMRPNDLFPQLARKIALRLPTFLSGVQLFVEGLVKKRLLADPCGQIADRVFAFPAGIDPTAAWLAALAYTVQIYGDFAGYTDMGRGIARMLGLELPVNFAAPYTAASIREFWRRWHISLSTWLRDYVYIPLGGNRRGNAEVNLLVTMLLGGAWHGAGWTFVLWGAYHGVLVAAGRHWPVAVPRPLAWVGTLFLVINGWVLFRSHDLGTYGSMLQALYGLQPGRVLPTRDAAFALMAFAIVMAGMGLSRFAPRIAEAMTAPRAVSGVVYAATLGAVLLFAPTITTPFIYFRF